MYFSMCFFSSQADILWAKSQEAVINIAKEMQKMFNLVLFSF